MRLIRKTRVRSQAFEDVVGDRRVATAGRISEARRFSSRHVDVQTQRDASATF